MSDVAATPLIDNNANATTSAVENASGENNSTQQAHASDAESRWIRRRKEFLRNVLARLDQLVFIELAALYYMDNWSVLLVVRSVIQLCLAAPALYADTFKARDPTFKHKSLHLLMLVIFLNIAALLLHIFAHPASAGEPTRFYLHGSLIIDFIGQRARSDWLGKAKLCAVDFVVLILQVLSCGVVEELMKTTTLISVSGTGRSDILQARNISASTSQESTTEGIELQSLLHHATAGEADGSQSSLEDREAQAWHALNAQYSGQSVLFDFNVVATIVNEYWDYKNWHRIGTV